MSKTSSKGNESDSASSGQVVSRAAAILRALADDASGQSLGQIAQKVGLPRTTVHRIVASLEAQQLAATTSSGIKLGPALVRLAASAHTNVITASRPFVEALGRRLRETVDLCVFRGHHSVSVDQYASDQELRVVSAVGTAFPVHCTAHGKALLSSLPESQLQSLLQEDLEKRTDHTLTNPPELLEDIKRARARGWAMDEEEHAIGVCGLGVPLATGGTERYALSVAIPSVRLAGRQEAYIAALMQCKTEIESLLGS